MKTDKVIPTARLDKCYLTGGGDRVAYYVHVYDSTSAFPVGYYGAETPRDAAYKARLEYPNLVIYDEDNRPLDL